MPRARRARSHRRVGAGIPLMSRVALLHGFLGSPADWADVLQQLPSGVECDCVPLLELDCRSIAGAASQLALRLERDPCDLLVGYSMGGRIALELAATRLELVPRLMLLSSSPGIDDAVDGPDARMKRAREDDQRAAEILRDGLDAFVERWYQLPLFAPFAAHPSFNATRLRRARGEAAFWAQAISGCSPGRTTPRWNALPKIASRTLFAAGELDERYAAIARHAKALAPALRIEIAAQAGHVLPIEAPAFCAKLIGEFLPHQPDELSKS